MDAPIRVMSLAIMPRTKADQENLGQGLGKLMAEDPTFGVKSNEETGQTVISAVSMATPRSS